MKSWIPAIILDPSIQKVIVFLHIWHPKCFRSMIGNLDYFTLLMNNEPWSILIGGMQSEYCVSEDRYNLVRICCHLPFASCNTCAIYKPNVCILRSCRVSLPFFFCGPEIVSNQWHWQPCSALLSSSMTLIIVEASCCCLLLELQVHMCNKLANRHVRVGISEPSDVSCCDICENAPGIQDLRVHYIFQFLLSYVCCTYIYKDFEDLCFPLETCM